MIIVKTRRSALYSYIHEGLRRLWSLSVDENNETVNFDYEYNHCKIVNNKRYMKFDDVYLSEQDYNMIIDELINEPYRVNCGVKKYYLTEKDKTEVRMNIALGPSPWSCERTFAEKHPKYKILGKEIS